MSALKSPGAPHCGALSFCLAFVLLAIGAWQLVRPAPRLPDGPALFPWGSLNVEVEGRVSRPGRYECGVGTTVKEIIDAAGLCDDGDLSVFPAGRRLKPGEALFVPPLGCIAICLRLPEGEMRVCVPRNCRVCDLPRHIGQHAFSKSCFKSRRRLRQGETVTISSGD